MGEREENNKKYERTLVDGDDEGMRGEQFERLIRFSVEKENGTEQTQDSFCRFLCACHVRYI
jgi:hypothetical protein